MQETSSCWKLSAKNTTFSLEEVAPVQEKGQTVSSTLIRELIQEYRFAEIPSYLGRDFSIYGEVVHGEHRGQKLGFPTANIQPGITLALPNGVYVSKIKLAEKTHFGVSNVGKRPTFGENAVTLKLGFLILKKIFTVRIWRLFRFFS